jgi:phosphonate transport system ATP-binding protein
VATLHQVDMALAHFPRIVGLRDGALAFDLPAAQVTRERLARLYAQHEHELLGAPARRRRPADPPPPPRRGDALPLNAVGAPLPLQPL